MIKITWLLEITKEASRIALGHFGNTRGTLKPDNTWVTQADLEVEQFLRAEIQQARPQDAVLGEEGEKALPRAQVVWAIDPIDGTRVFNHGLPVWGISIGALINGVPVLGAISLPALGDTYCTDGQTAWCNQTPLSPPKPVMDANALLLISEGAFQSEETDFEGKIIRLGSAAANLCYVARGSAVGAVDRACIWDYAAGAAILRVLGVPFKYASGKEVDFRALLGNPAVQEPTLICPPQHFNTLKKAIKNLR